MRYASRFLCFRLKCNETIRIGITWKLEQYAFIQISVEVFCVIIRVPTLYFLQDIAANFKCVCICDGIICMKNIPL